MTHDFELHLYRNQNFITETQCLSLSIQREAYTPYEEINAVFIASHADYTGVTRIGLYHNQTRIFLGLVDTLTQYTKNHSNLIRIKSKSFTSLLTQNELPAGLHSNLTMEQLMTDYYTFPYITYDTLPDTGYIFVKSGNTMWDGIVSFCYKMTGHYPFVIHNHIYLSNPPSQALFTPDPANILEYGHITDHTKLISHYHMEDISGQSDSYHQENAYATASEIVRHKQIPFDRSFLYDPNDALTFRNLYSRRGCQADYVIYQGFDNLHTGRKLTINGLTENQTISRVKFTFGSRGGITQLWCYHDGFYNNS